MSIICKVDRRKKISDSTISLYRYAIAGDTKDQRIKDQTEKLSYVYSSSELPYFDNKRINDIEYLNERKKTISNHFDNAVNMRMHGSKSKFNNRFAHFIIAPSQEEYGKHSNEKLTDMAKEAFCDFYKVPVEDFLGTVVIHETNDSGIKKNDIHVIGATADSNGRKNAYFAKGQLLNNLQKTSRMIEKKFNLSQYEGGIRPKYANHNKAVKNITKQEMAYLKEHGEHKPIAHIKSTLSENLNGDFLDTIEALNEKCIYMKFNFNNDNEITAMSFFYNDEAIKLSQVKATRLDGKKLTSKEFIEEQFGYDKYNPNHRDLAEKQNILNEEESSVCTLFSKNNSLNINTQRLVPDDYWNKVLERMNNGLVQLNGRSVGVIEEANRIVFTNKSLTTLRVSLMMAIEKFNESNIEGEYKCSLHTNAGRETKKKIYLLLEELKSKDPEKYGNVEINFKPSKKLMEQASRNAHYNKIKKDMLIRLSKSNKKLLPEERIVDISDLSQHDAYIAYEILEEEKARNPDKFHLVSIEGYKPTLLQSFKQNDQLEIYYNEVRNKAVNDYLNPRDIKQYGYEQARSYAAVHGEAVVRKEKKRRKKAMKQAQKSFEEKYSFYLSQINDSDNIDFFKNEKLRNDYLKYLELTVDSEERLTPEEYLEYTRKTTKIIEDKPIKIIKEEERIKRKTRFNI